MPETKPTKKRLLQTIIVLAILVVFPIGSWYFLQKGFDFTKEKYEKLDSLGQAVLDTFQLQNDENFTTAALKGHLSLVGNLHNASKEELAIIEGFWKKFDDRKDFIFLFYDSDTTVYSQHAVFKEYDFYRDEEQVKIANRTGLTSEEFFKRFQLDSSLHSNELILVDTGMEVRGRYDISDPEDRDLIVSHIVFLLPKD